MTFFYPPPRWAQFRGRICGIPCYVGDDREESPTVMGTNWLFDWMITWFVPLIQRIVDATAVLIWGEQTEGFGIELIERYTHVPCEPIDNEGTTDGLDDPRDDGGTTTL